MNLVNCKSALKTLKSGLPIIFQQTLYLQLDACQNFQKLFMSLKKEIEINP